MKVKLWGVRGTMPTPAKSKMNTGGNTTCVEVRLDNGTIIIIDAGTGILDLGESLMKEFNGSPPPIHLFFSHFHWDHVHGFPFFAPNFREATELNVYGPSPENRSLETSLIASMHDDFCPICYHTLPAKINISEIAPDTYTLAGATITVEEHDHPGGAFSFRIEENGKIFAFHTDTEHFHNVFDERVVRLSQDADLMIHDAQYTPNELPSRKGFGHSTWVQCVEIAKLANVKYLGLTHHDTLRKDDEIDLLEKEAQKSYSHTFFCREGMEIFL